MKYIVAAASLIFTTLACAAADETTTKSMPFDQCLKVIEKTSTDLGVAAVTVTDSADLRKVNFPSTDGAVVVTCDKPAQKITMTVSKK